MAKRKAKGVSECHGVDVGRDGSCTFCGQTPEEAHDAAVAVSEASRTLRRRINAEGGIVLEETDCCFDGCVEGVWFDTNKACPVCGGRGVLWREVVDDKKS